MDSVLSAVSQSGLALEYASEKLQDDAEVVLKAITENKDALMYASKRLQVLVNKLYILPPQFKTHKKEFIFTNARL